MESASAQLNTYRQSPRKVRLLADLVRGKKVPVAISALQFANKRAADPIVKLIQSAVANAKNKGMDTDALVVSGITVNAGQVLMRRLPMSRGRAFNKRKRTSHISVTVGAPAADKTKKTATVGPKKAKSAKTTTK